MARVSSSTFDQFPPTVSSGRRDAIIDVAACCFARRGFHGVSMRDIAKANESSVATLYNHFTSKDDLLLAIGERFFTVFVPDLNQAVVGPGDGLTRILAMVKTTYDDGCAYRNEFLSLVHDRRHVGMTAELTPLVVARNTCVRLWHQVLEEGMKDGSIRPDVDPAAIVWIIFSAVTGILDENMASEFAGSVIQEPLVDLYALLTHGLQA